ncbi:MAG: hypothetical protein K2X93_04580 [Candidatus Obscuribacterales bacterium]|nr:hypothetical protein [Candidatus Obscuribacterales bacterium]
MARSSKKRSRTLMYLAMSLAAFSAFASVPQTLVVSGPDERFLVEIFQLRRDVLNIFIPLIVSLAAVLASALLGMPRRRLDLFTAGGVAFSAVLLAVLLQWIGFETFSSLFLKLAALTIICSTTVLWRLFPTTPPIEHQLVSLSRRRPAATALAPLDGKPSSPI